MTTTYAVAAWNTHRAACPEYLYDLALPGPCPDGRTRYALLCTRRDCPHPLYTDAPGPAPDITAAGWPPELIAAAMRDEWHHLAPIGTPTQGRLI